MSVRVDRPDLRTTLAQHPPRAFFVTGRHTVGGLTDLETTFVRDDLLAPRQVASADRLDQVG